MPFNPQDAIAFNSQKYQRISLVARIISWTCHMSHQNEFPAETVQADCSRARFSTWLRTGCDTTSCGTTPTWGWSPLYTVYSRIYANTEAETINNCSTTVVVVVASNRPFKATNYNHPPSDVGNTERQVSVTHHLPSGGASGNIQIRLQWIHQFLFIGSFIYFLFYSDTTTPTRCCLSWLSCGICKELTRSFWSS